MYIKIILEYKCDFIFSPFKNATNFFTATKCNFLKNKCNNFFYKCNKNIALVINYNIHIKYEINIGVSSFVIKLIIFKNTAIIKYFAI